MKPDGVATTPAEPTDDVVEPVPEAAATEEQVQQDSSPSSPQPNKPENEGEQEGANSTLPPPAKEVNGKFSKPKDKTKAPMKTKPASTKATITTGAASRPTTTQSQVANGVMKTASNGASKKPMSMTSEIKKNAPVGASTQVKKVPTAPRMQVKAAEQKAVTSARPVSSTSSGTRKTVAASSSTLSKKPVTGGSNAVVKPKTTAPRPATAPAAKASVSAAPNAAPIPKTARPTVATASRPTTSSAPVRLTTTASKSSALRTTVSAPSAAHSASSQPSKVSTTIAAKKDIKTTTSAVARKPLASTTTRSTATKASKPEPPKPVTAAKRLPTDTKTSQPKMDETRQVPTRKVPPSPRNTSSRTASGKMATEFGNHKQGVSSNLVSVKRQTAKPTQSVLPLVIKGKPLEEQSSESVEPSAILETTASVTSAAIAPVESVVEAQTPSVELAQPDQQTSALVEGQGEGVQLPASEPTNVDIVSTKETTDADPLAIQSVADVPVLLMSNPPPVVPESEKNHDYTATIPPMAQEMTEQESVTASPCEVPAKDLEIVEKQEQIIRNLDDEEEEEREGSQQVSLSDMSGTQPTEESRPGSAGLAGSVWRAGGLPSEFDSEDVSCSQQGASELSAPGVLEGTESMDDLGEASLKGADGEGASAGSPDFEKFPDILVNEDDDNDDDDDDDDEDRVDDMEVGSEMTEDPHRQCNDNEDEDDDVEMASEGVTESGLESYGNADEDDLAEDYRLDNLNRMQPSSIVPTALSAANPFADAWMQSLQPDPTLDSSPSSNPWQTYSELPNQPAAQACLDIGNAKTDLSSTQPPALTDPVPSSPQPSSEPAAEMDMGIKPGLASHSQRISQSSTLLGTELAIHTCSDASTPEELKDYSISPGLENQKQPLPASPIPVALPDIMQDLGICRSDRAGSEHEEEEPETLPADDMLAGLSTVTTSAPSSHSSATGDEASDTEGDMQISDPTEPGSTGNECFDSTQVVHSMSALVEECEEACVEMEGGGGSDTPQSATSAASYGFECTTSNSNAQSTTESCIKSPGIFSLENEEQLPDEAKDPSLIKELNLSPACAPADVDLLDQQGELPVNSEQQYMLCEKVTEELPEPCSLGGTVPTETGLDSASSSEHQQDLDLNAPHPYYSTICEKTDSFLTGSDICAQQQGKIPTVHTARPPKHHSGLRVDHVTRLPTDLPPRMPNAGCSAQLRQLERHQQQLEEIEQRREQQNLRAEKQMEEGEGEKKEEKNQGEGELEQKTWEEKERELEEERRDLLHLQIQQQQQELKQRQQIMQWQQELEQQQQQSKHQNSHQKNLTTVLLSPSGLCTIYEALESSDAEEDFEDKMESKEMVLKVKVENECSPKERSSIPEAGSSSDNPDSTNPIQYHEGLTHSLALDSPPLFGSSSPQQPSPLELDWSKKADIVQQLINQTLLLNGDNCSPLLLLPGGAAGTLSPLEMSLWPSLPPLTPPSATVTSVSSFSAEISGSSPQGEWTVVELETHH
ncbi:mucin-17 [Pangasianodon hypophthalmus]|uniref:mucin-17 n=1 Tax=Pangasianodon hypophthalmus TaxID=310915 RepID=UPI000EFEF855|nr:mucin-17 [Pangasianodon hypophthalmus]XP_026787465.3 mucin-17 [Pangasianodon hypophthalmus]